jgi:hypothetical protein
MPKLRRERDALTGRFLKSNTTSLRHGGFASDSKDIPLQVRRQVGTLVEAGIAGWKIQLYLYTPIPDVDPVTPTDCASGNWSLVAEMVTDGNGDYTFPNITTTGYYKVVEVFPLKTACGDWEPTTPATCILLDMTTLQDYLDQNFGNVCYVKGGLTIGYWKTHAVQVRKGPKPDPIFAFGYTPATFPIYLGLAPGCYPPNPVIEDPTEVNALLTLAEAASDNGKAMLAAQLLGAKLNVLKFVGCSFGSAIYVGTVGAYNGMTVSAIIAAADAILCNPNALKDDVIALKDALDQINNNETVRVLLSGVACGVTYPQII